MVYARSLTKRYGSLNALAGVDLAVPAGELLFVVGPSGAGKSTLLALIRGDLRPTGGELLVAGLALHRARSWSRTAHRRQVAMVPQDYRLLPRLTALENVVFALTATDIRLRHAAARQRAAEQLTLVGLGDRLDAFPDQLSGGQQQRLAVARALACRPTILLADEPTGNLDAVNSHKIVDLLAEVAAEGTTVIVATHDLSAIRNRSGSLLLLEQGEVVTSMVLRQSRHRVSAIAS
jgi:cell division transport system ATP-binding protein